MDLKTEVQNLTDNFNSILSIEKAIELKLHKGPGNGSGNRNLISKVYIHSVIYGSNRESVTYPKCYEDQVNLDDFSEKILAYKKYRTENQLSLGQGVIGFIIHGENDELNQTRPIRKDIRNYYKKFPCITCGTSNTICDHKNDLYNDSRVLCESTQTLEDFQPLCNNCNLRKRAVSIKTIKEKKRQPPPPHIRMLGYDFIKGDENLDLNDPHAMEGTYWYDPVYFIKQVKLLIQSN